MITLMLHYRKVPSSILNPETWYDEMFRRFKGSPLAAYRFSSISNQTWSYVSYEVGKAYENKPGNT